MGHLMSECRAVGCMMCLTFRSGGEVLERISLFGEVAERSCMNHYSDISYVVALPRFPSLYTWLDGRPFGPPVFLTSLLGAASANPKPTAGNSRRVHIQRHSSQRGLSISSEPAEGDAQLSRGRVKTKTCGVESKLAKTHGWDAIPIKTHTNI